MRNLGILTSELCISNNCKLKNGSSVPFGIMYSRFLILNHDGFRLGRNIILMSTNVRTNRIVTYVDTVTIKLTSYL